MHNKSFATANKIGKIKSTGSGKKIQPPPYGIDFADRQINSTETILQCKLTPAKKKKTGPGESNPVSAVTSQTPNSTGLPEKMKSGFEKLSGHLLDDVRVHYNSDKPAQVNALAYTQGSDIHFAPGQKGEQLLAHELAHVIQQKEGRVQPTMQVGETLINDDSGLENEADLIAKRAASI